MIPRSRIGSREEVAYHGSAHNGMGCLCVGGFLLQDFLGDYLLGCPGLDLSRALQKNPSVFTLHRSHMIEEDDPNEVL